MPTPVRITLRKNLARAIRGGHPWVFREAVQSPPSLASGTPVLVTARDGRPLGTGFWDAGSAIAVRLLSAGRLSDPRVLIADRLGTALERRLAWLDLSRTSSFRWVHGEADRLPGLHVDVYGRYATVRYDGAGARVFYGGLAELLAAAGASLPIETVIVRRQSRGQAGQGTADIVLGKPPPPEIEVIEDGLRFEVNLVSGQKGGLFLDQRENRERIRALARGRTVLNLFGYTGAFSIHAAAGGAKSTTTVDAARPALAAARRNLERNGLGETARLVEADAFAFLERAARERERFDLVISDPPSFAPSRRAVPAALRAYRRLHRLAAALVPPGGWFCACSCSSHVDRRSFLETVIRGVQEAGARFVLLEERGAARDHPVIPEFPEGDYLKFLLGRIEPVSRAIISPA